MGVSTTFKEYQTGVRKCGRQYCDRQNVQRKGTSYNTVPVSLIQTEKCHAEIGQLSYTNQNKVMDT